MLGGKGGTQPPSSLHAGVVFVEFLAADDAVTVGVDILELVMLRFHHAGARWLLHPLHALHHLHHALAPGQFDCGAALCHDLHACGTEFLEGRFAVLVSIGTLVGGLLATGLIQRFSIWQIGRMVGVISHVPELKERIDVRLEVRASESGSRAGFRLP